MNLPGLGDKDISRAALEGLAVRVSGFVLANPELKKTLPGLPG
jgi:hypothetical protein